MPWATNSRERYTFDWKRQVELDLHSEIAQTVRDEHSDDLPAAVEDFNQKQGFSAGEVPRLGAHGLREASQDLGVEVVDFGAD